VTATNIYAGEVPPLPEGNNSVLASATEAEEEEILLEEAATEAAPEQENSYLNGLALSTQEFHGEETYDGTDDGLYDDSLEEEFVSPFDNAVRVLPEAAPSERPATRTTIVEYAVQDGDTVASIADRFGLTMSTVLAANGLSSRGLIRPGQVLRILPVDGVIYKIKKGDTLLKIAQTYRSELEKIMEMNGLSSEMVAVGTELILPDGRAPAPPAPKPPSRLASNIRDVFIPPPAADRVGTSKLLWPTAVRRITQYYRRGHTGVDIAGPMGTPIYASDDGVVVTSGWNRGGYGNMIIVDHGNGILTRYAHHTKNLVGVGDAVKRGDVIALMGSTGRSTGPHLHFEVMLGSTSRRANPLDYVR
jgi:murein DD-endopeptidase MepM/ murein hydrolase activator NlpD